MEKIKITYLMFCVVFAILSVFLTKQLIFYKNSLNMATIFSPLPPFLSLLENTEVTTLDLWEPKLESVAGAADKKLNISAKSALVYDLKENKVLFEKNSKTKLPIASLTKVMTAIVSLENPKKNNKYLVKKSDLVGENSMGLTEDEELAMEELLYGLILQSGNDAAEVLASNYSNGRQKFIEAMNRKTQTLGLSDTEFTNPSGLEGDGNQHSTAYDLLVITKYALENFSLFQKVISTIDYYIPKTEKHKAYYLSNETNLLTSYPGVKGVKDGYTPEAGLCLITYLDYKDHKIVGIILGSNNRRQEMKDLLDYSLNSLGIKPPKHS